MKAPNRNGFSLIELLVVIAVVAILAAILAPVFSRWRNEAQSSASDQNIKRLAMSTLQYVQDNDNKFPRTGYGCRGHNDTLPGDNTIFAVGESNQCGGDDWQDAIGPYIKDATAFLAPGDHSVCTTGTWGGACGQDFKATDGNLSYLYNDMLSHKMSTKANGYADAQTLTAQSDGLKIAELKKPSDCLMLAEGHSGWNKDGSNPPNTVVTDWTGSTDLQNKWHHEYALSINVSFFLSAKAYDGLTAIRVGLPFNNNGGNVAFADGHVAFTAYSNKHGSPVLCKTLPWTKNIDPLQRKADRDSCNDPDNPLRAGMGRSNWQ